MPIFLGKRDSKAENHWIDVPPRTHFGEGSEEYNYADMYKHKTILCLPGDGAEKAKAANGMCKYIEEMLSDEAKQVLGENIYSTYYDVAFRTDENDAKAFFTEYLVPFIAKPEAAIKLKAGEKLGPEDALSVEQAKENMRNLIIFTHCHGSEVIARIESCFRTTLKDLGYSENDRNQIMKQMFVLHANDIQYNLGLTKATVIHRISQNDLVTTGGFHHDFYTSLKSNLEYRKLTEGHPVVWLTPTDNEGVLLFRFLKDLSIADHDGSFFKKNGMTPDALRGYELSGKVLDYVIASNGDMPDVNKIVAEAVRDDNDLKKFVNDISKAGTDYFEGINAEIEQFNKLQENIINRIKKGELKEIPKELFSFSDNKLELFFTESRNRESVISKLKSREPCVLDYLIQKGDPKQVEVVTKTFPQFAPELLSKTAYRGLVTGANKERLLSILEPLCVHNPACCQYFDYKAAQQLLQKSAKGSSHS